MILGPLLETYFLRALKMSEGDLMVIFSSDLANVMWVLLVISLFVPYLLQRRRAKTAALAPSSTTDC